MTIREAVRALVLALPMAMIAFGSIAAVQGRGGEKTAPRQTSPALLDEKVVAEVNAEKVTVGQVRQWMDRLDWRHNRRALGDEETRRLILKNLVQERLLLQYGRSSGLAGRGGEFRDQMAVMRTLGLGNAYYKRVGAEQTPSEEEVKRFLTKPSQVVDFRIFFGATRKDAEEVRELVLGGADMDNLVRSRSVGPGAEKGGLVVGHGPGAIYFPPEIDARVLSEKEGWVSPIFENELGHNFARIERVIPFTPEQKKALLAKARDEAGQEKTRLFLEKLWESRGMTQNKTLLKDLEGLPPDRWGRKVDETVAEVGGEKISAGEFLVFLKKAYPEDPSPAGTGKVQERLQQYMRYRIYAQEAKALGLDRSSETEEGMRRHEEEALIDMVVRQIERKVKVSAKEGEAYFQRNRDSWKKPEARELSLIAFRSEEQAREILAALRSHPASFGSFARRFSVDRSAMNGGKLGVVPKGRLSKKVEESVFGAAEGEIVGPLPLEGQYLLLLVERKIPAEPEPRYSDHSAEALEKARREKSREAIQAKKEALYRKAEIQIFTDVLGKIEWPDRGTPVGGTTH